MGLDEIAREARIRLPEPPRLEIDQGRTARDDVKSKCAMEYRTEGAVSLSCARVRVRRCNVAGKERGDSKSRPVLTADEVRHFAGSVTDHTVVEILEAQPNVEELESAVLYAQGQGDVAERAGQELEGTAARIYDILTRDELYLLDDR
jgi:hypothetical protein